MKLGSLFSGGGLGDFGFMAAGMEISWQCEIDPYCQKILALRYPESKKYTDIKNLKGSDLDQVDIITGGFPCQPFSNAGKKGGADDNRYLWPEMLRIIKECRPTWIVGENVPGIINMALDNVCASLEEEGYSVQTLLFPAGALGAPHRRDRLWILAHTNNGRVQIGRGSSAISEESEGLGGVQESITSGMYEQKEEMVADPVISGSQIRRESSSEGRPTQRKREIELFCADQWRKYWATEPAVGRVANGIADRVHRLKMLGNGQVPACTYVIGRMIMEIEK